MSDLDNRRTKPLPTFCETSGLQVDRHVVGTVIVVRAAGELDLATAGMLDTHLQVAEAVAVPPAPIVLDLTQITFLAARGIRVLVEHHRRCLEAGSSLRLVACQRSVLRPLRLTEVDAWFTITATVTQALAPDNAE